MRSILVILFALLSTQALDAQSGLPDSLYPKNWRWYEALRFRAPEIGVDRYFPFKDRAFVRLQNPMDKLYNVKGGVGSVLDDLKYYSFRLIGLFYKDRIGLELYYGGFSARVDEQPVNDYLAAKFFNLYNNISSYHNHDYIFSGWQYGLAYKHHWKGLVLEPKFILGFEKMDARINKWSFKEMGSNQTTDYYFSYWDSTRNNKSIHLQLRLAKRFGVTFNKLPSYNGQKPHLVFELGLKTEYIIAAKRQLYVQITEKAYDKPTIEESAMVPMRYQSFAAGLYFTVYFMNPHLVH